MLKLFPTVLFFLALCVSVAAQTAQKPCSAPQANQFDFWLGEWDLEWKTAEGKTQKGSNTITKILGGCVIQENFDGGEMNFRGMSHSVFDARGGGVWKQTWVDSSGGYLDFTGGWKDGKMTLWREFTDQNGKKIMQRMFFYNISQDKLEWNWESSNDCGETWKLNWKIHYKRRK